LNCVYEVAQPMNDLPKSPIIGIDRGASFTDFAVIASDRLVDTLSIEKRDWQSITNTYDRIKGRYQTHRSVFTGSISDMPDSMREEVQMIPEIDAIGFGGQALSNPIYLPATSRIRDCLWSGHEVQSRPDGKMNVEVGGRNAETNDSMSDCHIFHIPPSDFPILAII
jgi:hypothetical protein